MESTTISLLVLLPIIVATILVRRTNERRRLPPGPRGVPVLGSLPFLDPELHRCFADIAGKYGPVSSLRLGSRLFVLISSSSAAMEIFKVRDTVFANHAAPLVARIFNSEDIAWEPYGPVWRMLRKVTVRELLNHAVIESFQSLRRQVIHGMIAELKSKAGTEVNIRDALYSATLDEMLGMIWVAAPEEKQEEKSTKKELLEVVGGAVELIGAPNISDYLPLLSPLDLQGLQRKMEVLTKRFNAVVDSIMEKRVPTNGIAAARDFLQLLVDLVDRNDPDMPLTRIHARGIIFNMIAGGTDTTSSTVEWAMSELMCHPIIMAKVREELDSVVGRGCVLEESHIPKLKYMDAVVKETLRLYPVLPLLVPRAPNETCEVGGCTIPEGTTIFVNAWPLEFRPDRFLERTGDGGRSFEFCPFGGGRRICVGMSLGERMVMYLLGSLLHSMEWQLPRGTVAVDLREKYGTVMKKAEPLVLVPCARKSGPPES